MNITETGSESSKSRAVEFARGNFMSATDHRIVRDDDDDDTATTM